MSYPSLDHKILSIVSSSFSVQRHNRYFPFHQRLFSQELCLVGNNISKQELSPGFSAAPVAEPKRRISHLHEVVLILAYVTLLTQVLLKSAKIMMTISYSMSMLWIKFSGNWLLDLVRIAVVSPRLKVDSPGLYSLVNARTRNNAFDVKFWVMYLVVHLAWQWMKERGIWHEPGESTTSLSESVPSVKWSAKGFQHFIKF